MKTALPSALLSLCLLASCESKPAPVPAPAPTPVAPAPPPPPVVVEAPRPEPVRAPIERTQRLIRLASGELVGKALVRLGFDQATADALQTPLNAVYDYRRAVNNDEFIGTFEAGKPVALSIRRSVLSEWHARKADAGWTAQAREIPLEKRIHRIELTVEANLYLTLQRAGADPDLAMGLADVFAWDIDFYREVQNGDVARAVVEEFWSNGRFVHYGEVLGADYESKTLGNKHAFRYVDGKGDASFFAADGSSARKAFLKSPMKYVNITSGYGGRIDPILHYQDTHHGVDYGAPAGTPIWSVGEGTVSSKGTGDMSGNYVCVAHRNGLTTCYCHMSAFGEGVQKGVHVAQKQVIGYVGQTGRATGPHLHFSLLRGGEYLNPLTQKYPSGDPVPEIDLPTFHAQIDPVEKLLHPAKIAQAGMPQLGPNDIANP